jgi:hypothetical protein
MYYGAIYGQLLQLAVVPSMQHTPRYGAIYARFIQLTAEHKHNYCVAWWWVYGLYPSSEE